MSKINQWKEQYREIMEAFLELRDQFEGSEVVFDNMIGQITMGDMIHYTKMYELENLSCQMSNAYDAGLDFIYEVDQDSLIRVCDDQELQEAFYSVFFKSGTQLILGFYNTQEMLEDGSDEAVSITVGQDEYYTPFSHLENLIV